jgi:hypothetical protein
VQNGAGPPPFVQPIALAQEDFGRWSTWLAPAESVRGATAPGADESWQATQLLPRGQSAASPPAHSAHRAPQPASPAPAPLTGGVSPASAVGAGASFTTVLALATLLILAALLALRRLRLDGESWRLAPFVLIADRPG